MVIKSRYLSFFFLFITGCRLVYHKETWTIFSFYKVHTAFNKKSSYLYNPNVQNFIKNHSDIFQFIKQRINGKIFQVTSHSLSVLPSPHFFTYDTVCFENRCELATIGTQFYASAGPNWNLKWWLQFSGKTPVCGTGIEGPIPSSHPKK